MEWWPCIWIALVPLFFVLDGKSIKSAFGWGYACGFLFFAGTLGWFIYVTYPGAFLIIAYLSLYFAVFAAAFVYFKKLPLVTRILTLAAVWAALEFIRAHALSGFGWVSLGHSQYKNYLLIQIADITGVYGISFLVVLVNMLVFETFKWLSFSKGNVQDLRRAQALVIGLLVLALGYGVFTLTTPHAYPQVRVGVVQPNIPQSLKWKPGLKGEIIARNIQLTRGFAADKPEIIIWPETSLPGILWESPELVEEIKKTAKSLQVPIMIGVITQDGEKYYNSAVLISAEGVIKGRYNKIHLVPFGEYLPLRPLLGFINQFIPLEDFTPGKEYKLFPAGCDEKKFGVLICFEDTVSEVHRNFVNAGASFLVNMTNDAWFEDTKAPFLHMQTAVFGAIENKRSLVRAANTGFSGFIDPFGRIIGAVHNSAGKNTYVTGIAQASIPVVKERSFYTKYGDVFTIVCFLGILGMMFNVRLRRKEDDE